jgi:hypothetical protein
LARPEALSWRVHLAARQPRKAAAAALTIVAAGVLAHFAWPGLPLGPVTAALLFLSLSEFFLPIHYRLTETDVSQRAGLSLRRMAWSQVRRWAVDTQGVRLSPLAGNSRLQAFRGVYLWLPDDPEPVLTMIRSRLGEQAAGADRAG